MSHDRGGVGGVGLHHPLDDFTKLLVQDDARLLVDLLKLAVTGKSTLQSNNTELFNIHPLVRKYLQLRILGLPTGQLARTVVNFFLSPPSQLEKKCAPKHSEQVDE